jgi:hypothetical protein
MSFEWHWVGDPPPRRPPEPEWTPCAPSPDGLPLEYRTVDGITYFRPDGRRAKDYEWNGERWAKRT